MGKQSREKWEKRKLTENEKIDSPKEYKKGLEKTCIFIIRWGACISLFAPLIVINQFFFPFVAPKTTIFRILIEFIFIAYIFLVFSNSKYRPKIDALTISLTVFLMVFILASFTGINLSRSFWSTYERMTGIFTMLHLYAFFIILKSVFKKREDWLRFLAASVLAGAFLSLYTLEKGAGISTRGGGTIGNSSFLAAYLIFDVFFAIILLLSKRIFWRIFAGLNLIPMMWVFLTSTARGATASFFIGLSLLFLGCLFFSEKKILKRLAVYLILAGVILAIFLAVIQPQPVRKEAAETIRDMGSRFVVWKTGLQGFLEKPVLGWGPENFNVVFLKNFNPCMSLVECGGEVWFDRVHNIILDTLVTTGAVGMAAYLSIFAVAIRLLLKNINKDVFLPLGLAVILIAYFLQNLLVFDMINSYLVFFLTLGFIGFLTEPKPDSAEAKTEAYAKKPNKFVLTTVIVSMIFILWQGNINSLIANRYIIKMMQPINVQKFISNFDKSLNTWMEKYETREQAAQQLITSSRQFTNLSQQDKETLSTVFKEVEEEMEKSAKENPLDFRHFFFLGDLYAASFKVTGNYDKLKIAETVFEKSITLSPSNQQGYWKLAEIYLAKGELNKAVFLLKKAVDIYPELGRSHWYLAMGYKITGQYEAFLNELDNAEKAGYNWRDSKEDAEKVLETYKIVNGDKEGTIKYLEKFLENYENHAGALITIASIYADLGQYDEARDIAKKFLEFYSDNPDLATKAEQFLQSLPK